MTTHVGAVVCVDFGSTFTKVLAVGLADGAVFAEAEHRTTIEDDVLHGYAAARAAVEAQCPGLGDAPVVACSSAGGGLRITVVGNEELVTAEAGRRVALSSGGRVVGVHAVGGTPYAPLAVAADQPDVVLLTGGTDGGNPAPLVDAAKRLVAGGWRGPVVLAGNAAAQDEAAGLLADGGCPVVRAGNVVPRIGVLEPDSARAAIREMFLAHVIGGKHLSAGDEFTAMVRGATPDVVLTGVELLARGLDETRPGAGDVVVVDVGGATTDVHSVVEIDPETAHLAHDVVGVNAVTRTVEGDLGMRWSALGTLVAAHPDEDGDLFAAARRRAEDPSFLPTDATEARYDEQLATAAVGVALRRHAGRARVVLSETGRVLERTGRDLRQVDVLVGSGGALRNAPESTAHRVLAAATGEVEGGWQLPADPALVVDAHYVLAAVGLLAGEHPGTAYRLARNLLGNLAR